MPPRRVKKDPEAVKMAEKLADPIDELFRKCDEKLRQTALLTARSEADRLIAQLPENIRKMKLSDFMANPNLNLEDILQLKSPKIEIEKTTETCDVDDAAHETSIPIAPSGQNSGRNTASSMHRNEIITPSGDVIPVPVIQPHKPFRLPHVDEEVAFSINGSPLVLNSKKARDTAV